MPPRKPKSKPAQRKKPAANKKNRPANREAKAPHPDGERLQKALAAAGVASRRECEELIVEGRVEVDGEVVRELGSRVNAETQEIRLDGEVLHKPKLVYFALHKPEGVVTTARDPSGRPRVIDLLPPSLGRVFPVGRLDMASEGLIILTNDGDLAQKLTHPKHGVEKTYHVQVAGAPEPETLAQLRQGIYLAEGFARVASVRFKSRHKKNTILEIVLDEGRNREIRRLLAKVGHKVQRLVRIAVGPVRLGEMPSGAYRPLTREEISALNADVVAKTKSRPRSRSARPRPSGAQIRSQASKDKSSQNSWSGASKSGNKSGNKMDSKRSVINQTLRRKAK